MNKDRWQHIEKIFYAAMEQPSGEREAFISQACAGNEELLLEVQALLAANQDAKSFLDSPVAMPPNSGSLSPTLVMPQAKPNSTSSAASGIRLGPYQLLREIGRGGMGAVWLAEDTRLHRKVALKLLPAEFTADAERVRRFTQEAQAASALSHPNIITVHDIGESAAGRFIVMELVAGRTLRAVIAEDHPPETLLAMGIQMAKALGAAHAAGITHRDIKPDNIMVRDDGYVKVLDFGLARLVPTDLGEESVTLSQQTMPGQLMGTVKYMSPEQARGETVGHPSDIFSLGVVFYELATGQHPFPAPSVVSLLNAIIADTPTPPSRLNPQLSAEMERLILRMLHKEARLRPAAAEVSAALRAIKRRSDLETEGQSEITTPIPPSLPAPSVPSSPIRHTVGRAQERQELRAAFNAASAGRGRLLCVSGEPGIGKTTVVEDFLAELAAAGQCSIARGRCSERLAGTEAYLPLLESLESLLQSGSHPAISRLLKQVAPTWYAQVASLSEGDQESAQLLAEVKAATQERMKRELVAFLQEAARQRPLVLFFDDLHWADVSTIDVLSFLASKFDALGVLIVVTYRPSDLLLAKHPFLQIKPDLQARGLCHELTLEFLNEAEIAEYLTLEFPGHRFPAGFPKLIHVKTEGSPLFMTDLVRYLRDRGVIVQTDSTWTLANSLPEIERDLPESVRGMIERKIAQLGEEDRKLLTAASVQGYEFDSAVVSRVLNLEADEVEERLEKLERVFAFVKLTSEAEFPNRTLTLKYRFVHVLYQNALYGALRVTRRASLSAGVAQSLLGFYGAQSHNVAGELANLFEVARDFAKSAEQFAIAAQSAAQVFANAEAIALTRRGLRALQMLPASADRDRQELALQLTLGLSLAATTFWAAPEVGEVHRRALGLCQQQAGNPQFFQVLTGLWSHHVIRAEMKAASELARQILRLAEEAQDSFMLELAHCFSGITMHHLGEFIAAGQHFEAGVSLYRPGQNPPHQSITAPSVGSASEWARNLWIMGYSDQALNQARQAYDLADSQSNPSTLGFALVFGAFIHQLRREEDACQEKAETVITLSHEKDIADNILWASCARGWAIARQGRTEEGIAQLRESTTICQAVGAEIALTQFLAMRAEAFCCAGQVKDALTTVDEALVMTSRNRDCYYDAELYRLRGELFLLNGVTELEAESCFRQAIEIAQQQRAKSWELRAATSLSRLWQQQGKTAEARQMLAEIYGWFTEGFDTADLKDAKALLEELKPRVRTGSVSDLSLAEGRDSEASGRSRSPYRTEATPSIAVLPFVNMSADADNEYFCDGLAEELLNALSKIEALRVAARTSSFFFKGKNADIREIGQRLNVGAVLEGSVRKAGNRLRITAQLINVTDGYHLWSEKYDREMQDIFDIQDEISLSIVDALKVKLLGAERAAVLKRYTEDTEAYQLYLLGRYQFGKYSEAGFRNAIAYFEKAISKEQGYAPAWSALANSYRALWYFGYLPPEESVPKWKEAINRALAIDQGLAECHLSRALLQFFYERDFVEAEKEFKRAMKLNPNYAEAHEQYGLFLAALGRAAEVMVEVRRALELDPLSLVNNLRVGWGYWVIGEFDLLREQSRKLIELEPNFYGGHWMSGLGFWAEGKYEQAAAELEKAVELGGNSIVLSMLGCLYGISDQRDKAQQVLTRFLESSEQRHGLRYDIGRVYAGLGEKDCAFEWIEQACERREGHLLFLKSEARSAFPEMNSDARLADLLRRLGLQ